MAIIFECHVQLNDNQSFIQNKGRKTHVSSASTPESRTTLANLYIASSVPEIFSNRSRMKFTISKSD
jgi:hypothetical protein